MSTNTYTVSQVSRLAHVTVRTLHHYDEIGLLVPSQRTASGYRQYSDADLHRLHQILLFKELGFSLEAIRSLIEEAPAERRHALLMQRALMQTELRKTNAVLRAIETAIQAIDGGNTMDNHEMFNGFEAFQSAEHAEEARERWGDTDAHQESTRRTKQYKKEDWVRMRAEGEAITARMAALLAAGRPAHDAEARTAAEQHRLHIDRWFYPCSHEMQVALSELYVADQRFAEYYESRAPGLAQFMADAIKANATKT